MNFKTRKRTSLFMSVIMLLSAFFFNFSPLVKPEVAEAVTLAEAQTAAQTYGLEDNVQDGVILHAFDWSFNTIKDNMKKIAEAGYTSIQTSPIQRSKENTAGCTNSVWWLYYQPAGFVIDNTGGSALGNKAEFTAMCEEAHKYGIHVIVDVVANHLGNQTKYNITNAALHGLTSSQYYHSDGFTEIGDYTNRYRVTHMSMGGLPDLDTENTYVQNLVITYLKECIDCGADGFRFDAAKHIGVPNDTDGHNSNFWPNVTSAAESYYATKGLYDDLYIYGEILDGTAGPSISEYTKYMAVTDNQTGNEIRGNVSGGNAASAATSSYKKNAGASNTVLWAESHDTYSNDNKESTYVSDSNINKTWALVGSRNKATALYFARTDGWRGGNIGTICSTQCFSKEVVAVNKFHNFYNGQSEYLGSNGSIAYNVRGGNGVILVNCSGTSTSANFSLKEAGMADGTYTDQVSGNTFTVSGGTITGNIGSTGIAVVYNAVTEPTPTISKEGGSFSTDTLSLTIGLKNATSGTYKIGSGSATTYTSSKTLTIGSDMSVGDSVTITLTATDGSKTTTKSYTFTKKETSSYKAYLSLPSGWSTPVYCYAYDDSDEDNVIKNGAWPGIQMSYDSSTSLYYYEIPEEMGSPKVIFYSTTGRYPADSEPGLTFSADEMIYKNGIWSEYSEGPEPTDDIDGNIYLNNAAGWSNQYVYRWKKSTAVNEAGWPGKAMTYDATTGYYYVARDDAYDMIIFNNNSGTQTDDLTLPSDKNVYNNSTGTWSCYCAEEKGTVVVNYVDASGKALTTAVTMTGKVGDSYTTSAKTFDGYTLSSTPSNATGTYVKGTTTVNYVYNVVSDDTPRVTSSLTDGSTFTTETATTTLTLTNAVSGTYTLDGGATKTFTNTVDVVLGQGKVGNSTITLECTAKNSSGETKSYTFTFNKKFVVKSGSGSSSSGAILTQEGLSSEKYVTSAGLGVKKTITSYSDFTEDMLIAQAAANDDARSFRGPHEGPVYDDYALYAAYDDTNLYVGWQYVNTADINAADQDYPKSDNGFPDNGDIPQMLAFYVPGQQTTDGRLANGKGVWGLDVTFDTPVSAIACFSSKSGSGTPGFFLPDSNGDLSYDSPYCLGFKSNGISYSSTRGYCLPSAIYGTTGNGYTGHTVSMLADASNFKELIAKGHDTAHDTFYMMTIPLSVLNTTASEVATNGIGVMHVSTFGESGINSVPMDYSMVDNAEKEYSEDASTSMEKQDSDTITMSLASVGASISGGTVTTPLQVNFGADASSPQVKDNARTLKATVYGGTAGYTCKFYVGSTLLATKTASGSTEVSTAWTPSAGGTYTIKCVVTDAAGESVTSSKEYVIEGGGTVITELDAPVAYATSDSNQTVKVSWDAVEGATSYQLYKYYASTKTIQKSKVVTTTYATFNGLTAGKTYKYIVQAVCDTAVSDNVDGSFAVDAMVGKKNSTSVVPTATFNYDKGYLELSWDKASGVSTYYVYKYYTKTKTLSAAKKVTGTSTKYYTATPGKTYRYLVSTKQFTGSALEGYNGKDCISINIPKID